MSADNDHDDIIPDPDDPESTGERAKAESFADLVDLMVDGDDLPGAMAQEQRALLEVATMVRSCSVEVPLHADRRDSLIDQALRRALEQSTATPALSPTDSDPAGPIIAPDITPLRPRTKIVRAIPWAVSAIAAAAAVFLFLSRPSDHTAAPPVATVETSHQSRPSDDLVGEITRDKSDDARARIDVIYADRLDGFRDMTLRGLQSRGGTR